MKKHNGYFFLVRNGRELGLHVLIAQTVLGRPIRLPHCVHHVDGNKTNNRNDNLVICEDNAYHRLIEARTKAYHIYGSPHARPCSYCHQYDLIENLRKSQTSHYHYACKVGYRHRKNVRTTVYTCKKCGWHGEITGRPRCLPCYAKATGQWRRSNPDKALALKNRSKQQRRNVK